MMVLIDTSVWSLAFRRRKGTMEDPMVAELQELIREMRVRIIGPIRQEILSGIREKKHFETLKVRLRAFPDLELEEEDFERAAELLNHCRVSGIQGSNTDFLICAVAERYDLCIFTTDKDFQRYQKFSSFALHAPRRE